MYHRYGRYGPHAWLLQRKRRFECPPNSVVPVVRIAIIYIQLPVVNAERIIIVMSGDDASKQVQIAVPGVVDANTNNVSHKQDPLQELKQELRTKARLEASIYAEKDMQNLEDPPTRADLLKAIGYLAANYVRSIAASWPGKSTTELFSDDIRELRDIFIDTFANAYFEELEDQGYDIPSTKEEIGIKRAARIDKKNDDNALSSVELSYQAAIRAQEQLRPDTRSGTGYIKDIARLADIYLNVYNDLTRKEVGGTNHPPEFRS